MKMTFKFVFLLLCNSCHTLGQISQDKRCFLESGATAAHIFANEDLQYGDVVGVIHVLGDPGLMGDIKLSLQEHDSPVIFSENSRNLTLVRPLDKEGKDGPSSVYINAICERKNTPDPAFVIPINIRVVDANDNSPEFINAPYILNISEVTVVGTRVLQGVRAIDADQPGPFSTVQYTVLSGPHSDHFIFVNALEGTLVLRKSLDYETLNNFSVGILAQDQGNPPQSSSTVLYVNVIDADDQNPAFTNDQYRIVVPLQIKSRRILKVIPAPIKAYDQDLGINASLKYSIQGGNLPFLHLNPDTAEILMDRPVHSNEIITPATLVLKATQVDNPDRFSLATVIISRQGTKLPVKFILKEFHANLPENIVPGSIVLTAGIYNGDENLMFWLDGATEDLELFYISKTGMLILKGNLDYEKRIQHNFLVHVTDGYNNDTSRINISVNDINEWEPRFRHPRYEFYPSTLRAGSIIGRLEAADGDRGDRVVLTLRGPDAKSFEIRNNGELVIQNLKLLNGTVARLVAVAFDTGKPPRSSMVPIIIHLPRNESIEIALTGTLTRMNGSVLLVSVFGTALGLLGVIVLVLIFYIYKYTAKRKEEIKNTKISGYVEKSPRTATLNSTTGIATDTKKSVNRSNQHNQFCCTDIDNPVFGEDNESSCSLNSKSIVSTRQIPAYLKTKVGPAPILPGLSATSTIPNVGGLVQNINNLQGQLSENNFDAYSRISSHFSEDAPDSLLSWPVGTIIHGMQKLSCDDNDRVADGVDERIENTVGKSSSANEQFNLTVYF